MGIGGSTPAGSRVVPRCEIRTLDTLGCFQRGRVLQRVVPGLYVRQEWKQWRLLQAPRCHLRRSIYDVRIRQVSDRRDRPEREFGQIRAQARERRWQLGSGRVGTTLRRCGREGGGPGGDPSRRVRDVGQQVHRMELGEQGAEARFGRHSVKGLSRARDEAHGVQPRRLQLSRVLPIRPGSK